MASRQRCILTEGVSTTKLDNVVNCQGNAVAKWMHAQVMASSVKQTASAEPMGTLYVSGHLRMFSAASASTGKHVSKAESQM